MTSSHRSRGSALTRRAVLPVAVLAMLLAACSSGGSGTASDSASGGGESSASSSASASASASATSAGTVTVPIGDQSVTVSSPIKTIALLVAGSANTYTWTAALEEGAKAAAEANGVELTIFEANFDPVVQFNQLQDAMASGLYQGLLIQPVSTQTCDLVTSDAVKDNLLVVALEVGLCGQDTEVGEGLWTPGSLTFIGGQYAMPGFLSYTGSILETNPGPQKVIEVIGPQDYGTTRSWDAAKAQTWAGAPEFEVTATVYTDFSTPDAYKKTLDALQANPDTTIIVSQYIDMTKGIIKAVQDLGKTGIKIYDFGGSIESVKMVESGEAVATFADYPISMGEAGVMAVVDAGLGKPVPKVILGDGKADAITTIITKDDLGSYTPQY